MIKHPNNNAWHRGSAHQSVLSLEMTEQEITQQQIWVNQRCFQPWQPKAQRRVNLAPMRVTLA